MSCSFFLFCSAPFSFQLTSNMFGTVKVFIVPGTCSLTNCFKFVFLTSPHVLAFDDFSKTVNVHIDASGSGLGAVLLLQQDGSEHVIAYGSRRLRRSEKYYPGHKLEFLALKWASLMNFKINFLTTISLFLQITILLLMSCPLVSLTRQIIARLLLCPHMILKSDKHNQDCDGLTRCLQ